MLWGSPAQVEMSRASIQAALRCAEGRTLVALPARPGTRPRLLGALLPDPGLRRRRGASNPRPARRDNLMSLLTEASAVLREPAGLLAARREWERLLGPERVFSGEQAALCYGANTEGLSRRLLAAVWPQDASDVAEVVK